MAHISASEVNAWLEETKLSLSLLNAPLEQTASNFVIQKLAKFFDVSTWVSTATTPELIRNLIAMYYASFEYDRAYADDATDTSNYAFILRRLVDTNINGLINGDIVLPE